MKSCKSTKKKEMLFIDTYVHVKRYYSISIIRITQYPRNKIGPIERFE